MDEEYKSLIKYAKPSVLIPQKNANLQTTSQNTKNKPVDENNIDDILNSILPPREYTKDKKHLYIENVLSTPATKLEVIDLHSVG